MPYYPEKPEIERSLKSEIITPHLVSKVIEKGSPSFSGKFNKEFVFFGYDCKKEDRFYTTSLHENQFYLAAYVRLFFSWPNINEKEFKDFYIVLVDNKIDLRYWDRDPQNDRNQFEHHLPITDVNLVRQIETCFEKILAYRKINILESESLATSKLEYSDVFELLNLITKESSKELEALVENMVKAYNNPESFPKPKENLHWELLTNSEVIDEIITLDWKCDFEDIIWAINESSKGKISLNPDDFNPDSYADDNLEIAGRLIEEKFSEFTIMYLDIPADCYFLFVVKKEDSKKIKALGKKCKINIVEGL